MVNSGVLSDFANGTGGSVVRNTNDLDGGLERLTRVPEIHLPAGVQTFRSESEWELPFSDGEVEYRPATERSGAQRLFRSEPIDELRR
jgi:hypothetical protein